MRQEIITDLKPYIKIYELVDRNVFNKFGDKAWRFFRTDLLETLLWIRTNIDSPITINNWYSNGNFQQRGLRHNLSAITEKKTKESSIYLSGHILGAAVDFDVKGKTADETRKWLLDNEDNLPYSIRLEHLNLKTKKTITWVHLDMLNDTKSKIYLFNV